MSKLAATVKVKRMKATRDLAMQTNGEQDMQDFVLVEASGKSDFEVGGITISVPISVTFHIPVGKVFVPMMGDSLRVILESV